MSPTSHRNEYLVGLFLLIGGLLAGGLILRFSRPQLNARGGYPLIVEVKDATGIRAGVPVRLGGVDIGRVAEDPVLNEDFVLLSIPLEIFSGNRIPTGSTVKVGTSGLMGDSYVRILPPERADGSFLPEGHRIRAEAAGSLTDLAGEAGQALEGVTDASMEMRTAANRIGSLAAKLDAEVFTAESIADLRSLLSDLRATAENLHRASERINPMLDTTDATLASLTKTSATADQTMKSVDATAQALLKTAENANPVIGAVDTTVKELHKSLTRLDTILTKVEGGQGTLGALMNDPEIQKDLGEVLDKLNRYGILFYPREGGPEKSEEEKKGPLLPGIRRQP